MSLDFIFGKSDKPSDFFRAITISGQGADLGWTCPTCHTVIRYGIQPGQKVTCCGATVTAPECKDWHDLTFKSLRRGLPELPKGFLLVDCWAQDGDSDWDRDSNAKSFDATAYEVPWA